MACKRLLVGSSLGDALQLELILKFWVMSMFALCFCFDQDNLVRSQFGNLLSLLSRTCQTQTGAVFEREDKCNLIILANTTKQEKKIFDRKSTASSECKERKRAKKMGTMSARLSSVTNLSNPEYNNASEEWPTRERKGEKDSPSFLSQVNERRE